MFSEACVKNSVHGGTYMAGGLHGGGHAWHGGCAWQGGMCGRGHTWQWGVHGRWHEGECAW